MINYDASGWQEQDAMLLGGRPKRIPRISQAHPVHFWYEFSDSLWRVIRLDIEGEEQIFGSISAYEARQETLRQRRFQDEVREWKRKHGHLRESPK